jgi:hypothetical protein
VYSICGCFQSSRSVVGNGSSNSSVRGLVLLKRVDRAREQEPGPWGPARGSTMSPRLPSAPRLFSRLSHASNRSHSSSFEADDERSSIASTDLPSRMSPDRRSSSSGGRSANSGPRINPNGNGNGGAFAHEDTRPTSSKELAGFYAYSFAAEVYVVCG